jgi:hypothetical protein
MSKMVILGLLIFILFLLILNSNKQQQPVGSVVATDTAWITTTKDTVIYNFISKDTIIHNPVFVKLEAPANAGEDSVKIYSDTLRNNQALIYYRASVTGRINSIQFGYADMEKERIRTVNRFGTVTKVLPEKNKLFAGTEIGQQNVSVAAYYQRQNQLYNYRYNIIQNTHNIGIAFKLF